MTSSFELIKVLPRIFFTNFIIKFAFPGKLQNLTSFINIYKKKKLQSFTKQSYYIVKSLGCKFAGINRQIRYVNEQRTPRIDHQRFMIDIRAEIVSRVVRNRSFTQTRDLRVVEFSTQFCDVNFSFENRSSFFAIFCRAFVVYVGTNVTGAVSLAFDCQGFRVWRNTDVYYYL